MTITRRTNFIYNEYSINDTKIGRTNEYKDLGIHFQSNMKFNTHYKTIINKALRALGFIIRNAKNFSKIETTLKLYNALVRPHLEYASVIWSPSANVHADSIEKVQKRFVRFLYVKKYNIYPYLVSYISLLECFSMKMLSYRRNLNCVIFIYCIINNIKYKSCAIINFISLIVPKINLRITKEKLFYVDPSSCSPITHMLCQCNAFIEKCGVSLLNTSISEIKSVF